MNSNITSATSLTTLCERDQKELVFSIMNKMRRDSNFFQKIVNEVKDDQEFDHSGIVKIQNR